MPLRALARAQRRAARSGRRASRGTRSSTAAASAAGRSSTTRASAPSTGRRPRNWRSRRSSRTAFPIRLTGRRRRARHVQPAPRGVPRRQHERKRHVPLQALPQARAAFEIHNSPLSEIAVIGFEFGYNVQEPRRLVVWEAQYGDFINGAQVIIDQFVTSARAKWGQTPSLVFLLPHGYEGQGPEHSSARPERILQAAADINLRLANCTTAAQYFHLLRRQALLLEADPLPLFVLTPKSLLRHPAVASTPLELAEGRFRARHRRRGAPRRARAQVDAARAVQRQGLRRPRDRVSSREAARHGGRRARRAALPLPRRADRSGRCSASYPNLREVVWLQEEPANMGAWEFVRPLLEPNSRQAAPVCPLQLHRPPAQRQPVRGLGGVARAEPASARRPGVRGRRRQRRPPSSSRR